MAIKVGGTTVVDDSRNICSVITVNATTVCAVNVCATGAFYGSGAGLTNIPGVATTVCPTNIVSGFTCLDTANYNYFKVRSNASVTICGITSNTIPNFYLDIITVQGATVTASTSCLASPYSNFALNTESSKRLLQFTNVEGIYYGRAYTSKDSDLVATYAGNALTYQALGGNNFAASCVYPTATSIIPTDAVLCVIPNASTPSIASPGCNYLLVSTEMFKCCWAWLCCVDARMLNERYGEATQATCSYYYACHNTYRQIYYNNSFYLVKSGSILNNGDPNLLNSYLLSAKYNSSVVNSQGFPGMLCPCTWIPTRGSNTGDQLRDPILTYSTTYDWIAVASGRCNCTVVTVYRLSCFLDRFNCCVLQTITLDCTSNSRDLYHLCSVHHNADICTFPAVLTYTKCPGTNGAPCCSSHNTYKFWSSGGCAGCPLCSSGCVWGWAPRNGSDSANQIFTTGKSNSFCANYMSTNGQYQWWIWKPNNDNCIEWCLFCDLCYGNCTVTCWQGICGFVGWGAGENCTCRCHYKIIDPDLCHLFVFGSVSGSNNGVQSSVCHGGWTRLSNNTIITSLTPKSFKPCTQACCQGWLNDSALNIAGFAVRLGCDFVTGCYCFYSCSFPCACNLICVAGGCCYGLIYDSATTTWGYGTVGHTANVRAKAANLGITSGISETMYPSLTNNEYNGCAFDLLGPMSLSTVQLLSKP